jgi:maleylpyruvate isomerase
VKLRLHNYWRSSASYRVRIALGLKGLAWDYVVVDILKGGAAGGGGQHDADYRAMNTMGQVPTLEIVEDDGRVHHLAQSLPIIEYLEERFPAPPLLPAGLEARAHARALAEVVNSGIQPLQNLTTTRQVQALGGDDRVWVQGFIHRGLGALETAVGASGLAGRYCIGDAPTLADCFLVPQIYSARRFGVDPAGFPRIAAIAAACDELPAFAAAHPDRQPDAVVAR